MGQPAPPCSTADITNQPQPDLPSTRQEPLESSLQPARDEAQPGTDKACDLFSIAARSARNSCPLFQVHLDTLQEPWSSQNSPHRLQVRSTLLTCPHCISVEVPAEPERPTPLQSLAITCSYDGLYCQSQKVMSANRSQSWAKGKC